MSSSAFFIEAAAKTVTVLSCAAAGEWTAPSSIRRATEIPARRYMIALRAYPQGALFARRNQACVWTIEATGGSAVPAIPMAYGRSEYREWADISRLAVRVKLPFVSAD